MKNTSFIFYATFYESTQCLTQNRRGKFLCKLLAYMAGEDAPVFSEKEKIERSLFLLMQPQILANLERRELSKNGGAPFNNQNASINKGPEVLQFFADNPEATPVECAKALNISIRTVYRYKNMAYPLSVFDYDPTTDFTEFNSANDNDSHVKSHDTGNDNGTDNDSAKSCAKQPNVNVNVNGNCNGNNTATATGNDNDNGNDNCPKTADGDDAAPAKKSVPDFPSSSPPRQNNANSGKENAAASTQSDNSGKTENITEFRVAGEPMRLAELLRDLHQKEDPRYRPTPMYIKKWAEDIEKINRIDKRSYEEIERVIRWVKTSGNFWFSNIMSGITLRKQFSRLFLGMTQRQTPHSTGRGNAIERSEADKIVIEAADIPF